MDDINIQYTGNKITKLTIITDSHLIKIDPVLNAFCLVFILVPDTINCSLWCQVRFPNEVYLVLCKFSIKHLVKPGF